MPSTETLEKEQFETMKEIWTVSALDGIRSSFYGKELEAAQKEVRVANAMLHNVESIPVSDSRIRPLIEGTAPQTHNEHLISGYNRAMELILRDHERLDFDKKTTLSLHRILFSELLCEKGAFRSGFEERMDELFLRYSKQTTEPLVYIPAIMDEFSSIAPFRDGNKRMRSLLTTLLLLKSRYIAHIYVGLDESQPLVSSLVNSYKEFERRYPIVDNHKVKKRDRILHIIETSPGPVRKRDICACIPDVSIRTADVVLSDLIEQNKIEKLGTYKDARYVLV